MPKTMRRQAGAMHKMGCHRNEFAVKHRKSPQNFRQSQDVREDRGTRQTKLGRPKEDIAR